MCRILNFFPLINILEHLNKAHTQRWLPDLNSFGLYLASSQKVKMAKENNYLYRLKDKASGSLQNFYASHYHEYAVHYFLEQFNRAYHLEVSEIETCQKIIHEKLIEKQYRKKVNLRSCMYNEAIQEIKNARTNFKSMCKMQRNRM